MSEVLNFEGQISDALFTTYTFDPAYFEQFVLSRLRNAGARVTVLADERMTEFDPYRSSQRAGRSYALGQIAHFRAFHPKLMVLSGPEQVVIGVGSGNLTEAGWHRNDELWSFFEGGPESLPSVAGSIGKWLENLGRSTSLAPQIEVAVQRVAHLLSSGPLQDESESVFVHNLDGGILGQLPSGPVDELHLYAPFHDAGARAIKRVIEHFRPARTVLGMQKACVADGEQLSRVALELGIEVVSLPDAPYRHGKLLEWVSDGERQALIGSPNITDVALHHSVADGNFEIGIVQQVENSLFPKQKSPEVTDLATFEIRRDAPGEQEEVEAARSQPRITAVFQTADVTEVYLDRTAEGPLIVDASEASAPDAWRKVGEFEPVPAVLQILEPLATGSWLRLRSGTLSGSRIPVSSLSAFESPRRHGSRTYLRPSIDDLFENEEISRRFFDDYEKAVRSQREDSASVPMSSTSRAATSEVDVSTSWEEYLDQLNGRMGPSLTRFALGLPPLVNSTFEPATVHDFDDESPEETVAALEDDNAEDDDIENDESPSEGALRERAQARLASQLEQAAEISRSEGEHRFIQDPGFHLLISRMTMTAIAGEIWSDKDDWVHLVLKHLEWFADADEEAPADIRNRQAAMAALMSALVEQRVPRLPPNPLASSVQRHIKRISGLFEDLTLEALHGYSDDLLIRRLGEALAPEMVMDYVENAVAGDVFDSAVATLAEFGGGIHSENQSPWLVLPKSASAARDVGLLAIKQLVGASPCGVRIGPHSERTTFLWVAPQLAIVEQADNRDVRRANLYQLEARCGPESCESLAALHKSAPIILEGTSKWARIATLFDAVESNY